MADAPEQIAFNRLALEVVDHVHLDGVRRHADRLGARVADGQQRQDRLVDFRTVHHAAARKKDSHFVPHDSSLP